MCAYAYACVCVDVHNMFGESWTMSKVMYMFKYLKYIAGAQGALL